MKIIISVVIGALLGSVMGYLGKCKNGICPLTSTPIRGAIWGAFLGLMFGLT